MTATYVFSGLEIRWFLFTSANRTTVFAQIALYADMAVWMVVSATQISGFRSEIEEADSTNTTMTVR